MTTAFVDGAQKMATALGMSGYRFAIIEHPISSASRTALEASAAATLVQSVHLLTSR